MKNAIDWIKSNPFNVVAGGIALLAFLMLGYFYFVAAPGFSEKNSALLKEQKQKQQRLIGVEVPLPNIDPNAEPMLEYVVINEKVINDVRSVYNSITQQYDTILAETSAKNANNHSGVLLGGGLLWPDADTNNFSLYDNAAIDYKKHFKAVFDYNNANPWNIAPMLASGPPPVQEIDLRLTEAAFNFINSIGVTTASELSQEQAQLLFEEQRVVLMDILTRRAGSIHLYATLPPEEDLFAVKETEDAPASAPALGGPLLGGGGDRPATADQASGLPADYPFKIAAWAYSNQAPKPDQLWEGQVQLWIMRDIMQTIHRVNKVGEVVEAVGPDGQVGQQRACVLNSPVKRLIRLQTMPGYVGMHTLGAAMLTGGTGDALPGSGGNINFDAGSNVTNLSIYPDPPSSLTPGDPKRQVPEHFGITPTGRVSNSVFDVRHSQLVIDIAWDDLPEFVEELRRTNFMTVIKINVKDLDEYELLREGYIYGNDDVVRAELVIESLWFRSWTQKWMPKIVRQKLLIEVPEGSNQDNFQQ